MYLLYTIFIISPIISLFSGLALTPIFILTFLILVSANFRSILSNNYSYLQYFKDHKLTATFFILVIGYMLSVTFIGNLETVKVMRVIKFFAIPAFGVVAYYCLKQREATNLKLFTYCLLASIIITLNTAMLDVFSDGFLTTHFRFYQPEYEYNPSELNRGVVYLALIFFPFFIMLYRTRKYYVFSTLLIAYMVCIAFLESMTATLSLLAAIIAFSLCSIFKKHVMTLMLLGVSFFILSSPFIANKINAIELSNGVLEAAPGSAKHRLFIWEFTASKAMEKKWFGWGVGASKSIPITNKDYIPPRWGKEFDESINLKNLNKLDTNLNKIHPLPLHPHNGTLQIWLELGAVGILFYVIVINLIGWKIIHSQNSHLEKNTYFSILILFVCIQQTGFGLWQEWLWSALILAILQTKIAFLQNSTKT